MGCSGSFLNKGDLATQIEQAAKDLSPKNKHLEPWLWFSIHLDDLPEHVHNPECSDMSHNRTSLQTVVGRTLQGEDQTGLRGIAYIFKGIVKACFYLHMNNAVHTHITPETVHLACDCEGPCDQASLSHFSKRPVLLGQEHIQQYPVGQPSAKPPHLLETAICSLARVLYCMLFRQEYPAGGMTKDDLNKQLQEYLAGYPWAFKWLRFIGVALAAETRNTGSTRTDLMDNSLADLYLDFLVEDLVMSPYHHDLKDKTFKLSSFQLRMGIIAQSYSVHSPRICFNLEKLAESETGIKATLDTVKQAFLQIMKIDIRIMKAEVKYLEDIKLLTSSEAHELDTKLEVKLKEIAKKLPKPAGGNAYSTSVGNHERMEQVQLLQAKLEELSTPDVDGTGQVVQSAFMKRLAAFDEHLFGKIYLWVHAQQNLLCWSEELLRKAMETNLTSFYSEINGDDRDYQPFDQKVSDQAKIMSGNYFSSKVNQLPDLRELVRGQDRYRIETSSFESTDNSKLFKGSMKVGDTTKEVIYKKVSQEAEDPFEESEIAASLKPNKHVIRPLKNLVITSPNQNPVLQEYETFKKPTKEQIGIGSELYIVMDYYRLGTIENYVKSQTGPLLDQVVLKIFLGVVAGFRYLRDEKVNHRDIKPKNILLDEHLVSVIIDFGISIKGNIQEQRANQAGNTPIYSSPEAQANLPETELVDIWSIGMILYYLLFKRPAYTKDNFEELLQSDGGFPTKYREPEPKQQLPEGTQITPLLYDLLDIMESCVVFEPTSRISWPNLLNHQLVRSYQDGTGWPGANFTFTTEQVESRVKINRYYIKISALVKQREKNTDTFWTKCASELKEIRNTITHLVHWHLNVLVHQELESIKLNVDFYQTSNARKQFKTFQEDFKKFLNEEKLPFHDKNAKRYNDSRTKLLTSVKALRTLWLQGEKSGLPVSAQDFKPVMGNLLMLALSEKNINLGFEEDTELDMIIGQQGITFFTNFINDIRLE